MFFLFKYTAKTEIYTYWNTLSLHDALPITPRSEKALELRANPMRRRDLRVLGVRPRIGHDGFRIVAASFVGGKIGRQAQGKIWARSEEHTSELQSLMRISYAVFFLKIKNTIPTYLTHYLTCNVLPLS